MELKVSAIVSQRRERALSNALAELQTEAAAHHPGLNIISSVSVDPKYEQELDGDFRDGTFQVSEITITVDGSVLAVIANDALLAIVRQAVQKIVVVARRDDGRLIISLRVPSGEYTITNREECQALLATLEADVTPEQQAKIEEHIRIIGELLSGRYPG
jgi:hypothetical protein